MVMNSKALAIQSKAERLRRVKRMESWLAAGIEPCANCCPEPPTVAEEIETIGLDLSDAAAILRSDPVGREPRLRALKDLRIAACRLSVIIHELEEV